MLPRISIVIPSFNQARYLRETLDSVLSQNYPDLEITVMDGGSTDGSADILREYAPRLAYWTSAPDGGQSSAINLGFARATGAIMTWLNSDDLLLPEALHTVGAIFAREAHIRWLTGQPANLSANGDLHVSRIRTARVPLFVRKGWYHGRLWGFIRQEGTFWRRDLWEEAGASLDVTRHYSMDHELWRRFAQHADLFTVDQVLAVFRHHEAQKTADLDAYYREAGIRTPHAARLIMRPLRVLLAPLLWCVSPTVQPKKTNPSP